MNNKSFTLIELLVVIVIIGILAGVIIVSTSSSISKANITKSKVFENNIQNELGANMVSRWKLDEIVGTTTTPDAWGTKTGTITSAPVLKTEAECVTGNCMYFDGVDDFIDCGDFTSYIGKNNLTFSIWVKPLINGIDGTYSYSFSAFMGKAGPGASGDIHVGYRSDNKVRIYFENLTAGAYFDSINPININDWSFIVVSANSSRTSLYINGVLSNYKDLATNFVINNMHIGHTIYATYFNGFIDDARIYNGNLTTSEIKQEYIAGLNSLLSQGSISEKEYNDRLSNLAQR